MAPLLLTGVTGGLGAKILHDLLHVQKVKPQDIIATSRSESRREEFESQGVQFRVLDYNRPETATSALQGVDQLFFVASATRDNAVRFQEHKTVVDAAKKAGVKRVWYNSLAFGGWGDDSKIGFQQVHYETENMLLESGMDFINIRAGIYADAFPLFLNWYPSSKKIYLPKLDPPTSVGGSAWASRDELGEAHAVLLAKGLEAFPSIKPVGPKRLILLTGPEAQSLDSMAGAISRAKGNDIPLEFLEPKAWVDESVTDDDGGKPRGWFEARLVYAEGTAKGDAEVVDPAMGVLLGRRPETGTETVERLLRENPKYTWHQNHAVPVPDY
ncbi:NAD(P)-binding protein [Polychaeton citri CBS 116435]|uniref:NAD(P)-binding protein n=1 Tax=Polychaeton citri CBS 116435 TaxID=1314669 RepID=A0A9P4Q1R9_9PEZI|nr:NAD(P)-binding protein [Polychaeton citri CBS 116435]